MSVLSCEQTYATTQHYKAFQCFIVTAMKTHDNKADLILSYRTSLTAIQSLNVCRNTVEQHLNTELNMVNNWMKIKHFAKIKTSTSYINWEINTLTVYLLIKIGETRIERVQNFHHSNLIRKIKLGHSYYYFIKIRITK